MLIGDKCVVSIEYTLKDNDGTVIDQSAEDQPLAYLHGFGNIIPGLEQELVGKVAGDSFQVTVSPEDAYGERVEQLVQQVPLATFPEPEKLEVGMRFTAQTEQGDIPVVITAIDNGEASVDANHPLAGVTLHFEGKVIDVRDATEEELEHGHAH
ncbi:peptidylprolyl isomerase [Endozoicomonas sp. SM1973]|uniref:Peptidyl-prolyl cis-trans isomerase n=1 Tax=Spartinivicinus marinus TaxID=2994442 RepID=A0A853I2B3_9GAMM|nr:peptidylprolyl isomerase [Spartinivicinus marinus]MCX4028277.1 peptidylprolyl isomerase [Spartinivicinus marinus]NYZ65612.1 peptidylprolyl isomerase [Spartinivicinus marinus]